MKNVGMWKLGVLIAILVAIVTAGFGQQLGVDTDEIESLIDEWNFANNTRNVHSFERVYSANVLFYTQQLTRRRAIALKRQLFDKKPYFRQRIITEISYKPYSKGVVKCDFTKEVFEKNGWKKYPSYLLVSYENKHYTIVGESDYATDRVLKFKPDLGEPITFQKAPTNVDTADDHASSAVITDTSASNFPDEDTTNFSRRWLQDDSTTVVSTAESWPSIFSDSSSLGVVTVPKGYVFILIGMLGLGALMIFIADSVQSRRRKRTVVQDSHQEAEHVVRDFKLQSGFEAFAITLFDPLFFRHRRVKTEHVYAGKNAGPEQGPDLVFDFVQKDTHVRFAIKCQYYKQVAKNEVQLFTSEQQRHFRQFEEDRDMDVYYVLGFGGKPDDPRELFFIPAKSVRGEYMSRAALMQFSKSGMFYYNRKAGKIQ